MPNLLSYGNGSFDRDDVDDAYMNGKHENGHSYENGYLQDEHVRIFFLNITCFCDKTCMFK